MKSCQIFLVIFFVLLFNTSQACDVGDWKQISMSTHIVKGTLKYPKEGLQKAIEQNEDRYVELLLTNVKYLKGDAIYDEINIRYYGFREGAESLPKLDLVENLNNKEVIAFLLIDSDSVIPKLCPVQMLEKKRYFYFVGNFACSLWPFEHLTEKSIEMEVEEQSRIVKNEACFHNPDTKTNQMVKTIIERMMEPRVARTAYSELEALGEMAVPYIIEHMDDRRGLPVPRISLVNKSSNSFEAIRHYGPKQVVDVLSAILNQLTGQHFFSIMNGSSEEIRNHEVNAWRVWLHKTRCGDNYRGRIATIPLPV